MERIFQVPPVEANLRPLPFICKKQTRRLQRSRASRAELCRGEAAARGAWRCGGRSGSHSARARRRTRSCTGRLAGCGLRSRPGVRGAVRWGRRTLHTVLRAHCAGISLRKSSRLGGKGQGGYETITFANSPPVLKWCRSVNLWHTLLKIDWGKQDQYIFLKGRKQKAHYLLTYLFCLPCLSPLRSETFLFLFTAASFNESICILSHDNRFIVR